MSNKPLVTVIIPVCHPLDEVRSTIESVVNQHYQSIQLIVVDGRPAKTPEEITRHFPQAEYIGQKQAGLAEARNIGLQHANGSIIATLDCGDTWKTDFLSRCVTKLEENNLDFVFANWVQKPNENRARDGLKTYPDLIPYIQETKDQWVDLSYPDTRSIYLAGCPSPSTSFLIRRTSIVNGWDSLLHIGIDWGLLLDLILIKKCKVSFCLDTLWIKNIDMNKFHHENAWNETTELLYVSDLKRLLEKNKPMLSTEEIEKIERLHQENMLGLAMYKLLKKGNLPQSYQLIKQSFRLGIAPAFSIFPNAFLACINRKYKSLNAAFNNNLLIPHHIRQI